MTVTCLLSPDRSPAPAATNGQPDHFQPSGDLGALQSLFLAILPRVETQARIYFRHLRCPGKRADAVAEAVALAWLWFVRLHERGEDASAFCWPLAFYAARAVRCGRQLVGKQSAQDAMSPLAQQRHGFRTLTLLSVLSQALRDDTHTPVPDQAAFRHDFPAWLATLPQRDQIIAEGLMLGERAPDAAKHGHSPERFSQLRHRLLSDWLCFCDETPSA